MAIHWKLHERRRHHASHHSPRTPALALRREEARSKSAEYHRRPTRQKLHQVLRHQQPTRLRTLSRRRKRMHLSMGKQRPRLLPADIHHRSFPPPSRFGNPLPGITSGEISTHSYRFSCYTSPEGGFGT